MGRRTALVLLAAVGASCAWTRPYTPEQPGARLYPYVAVLDQRTGEFRWGLLSKRRFVTRPVFFDAQPSSEGLAPARASDGGPWGFVDHTGEWAIAPRFAEVQPFSGGRAAVRERDTWDFIDRGGTRVSRLALAPAPDGRPPLGPLVDDLAPAWSGQAWGFVDDAGKWKLDSRYDDARPFSEGLAAVRTGDSWSFIDREGHPRLGGLRGEPSRFAAGMAAVPAKGLWGYVGAGGDIEIDPRFEQARAFAKDEGLAAAAQGGRWGFVDHRGRWVVPPTYDEVGDFSEGLAAILLGGRWGYVDVRGSVVIEPAYQGARPFTGGVAYVARGGTFAYIDRTGQQFWRAPGFR